MATYESIGYPTITTATDILNATAATEVDLALVSHGISLGQNTVANLTPSAPLSNVWFHFNMSIGSGTGIGTQRQFVAVLNTNNDVLFALRCIAGSVYRIEAYNVTANALVIQPFGGYSFRSGVVYQIDIRMFPGGFDFYVDGNLVSTASGLTQPLFNVATCRFTNMTSSTSASARVAISETIIGIGAASSTVGRRVRSRVPTANGALAAWATGGFANLDDGPGINDGVFATSNTAGDRSSYLAPAWAGNSPIEQVRLQSSALHDGAGVQNYQHFSRIAGVDYDHGLLNPGLTLASFDTVLTNSPASGVAWTDTEYATLELGIVSA